MISHDSKPSAVARPVRSSSYARQARRSAAEAAPDTRPFNLAKTLIVTTFFLAILFSPILGSLSPALAIASFGLYLAFNVNNVVKASFGNALLLAIAVFILISVIWSNARSDTLYYGVQYALTVLAGIAFVSDREDRDETHLAMFMAWFVSSFSALAFGHSVAWGDQGGTAFSGLVEGKNFNADMAVHGFIISLAMAYKSFDRRSLLLFLASAVAIAINVVIVGTSQSAGAIIGVAEVTIVFVVLAFARKLTTQTRVTTAIAFSGTAAVGALTAGIWFPPLLQQIQQYFGKDPTLTGRTYLWDRAAEIIATRPYLGQGYYAFWKKGNIDAEGLWRYAKINGRFGFNFHNSVIEIVVQLGWIGLSIIAIALSVYAMRLAVKYTVAPSITLSMWIAFLVYEIARTPYEAIGLAPLSHITLVLVMALASGATVRRTAVITPRAQLSPARS